MLTGHPPETIKFVKIEVILPFNYPLAECLTPSRHQLRLDELMKKSGVIGCLETSGLLQFLIYFFQMGKLFSRVGAGGAGSLLRGKAHPEDSIMGSSEAGREWEKRENPVFLWSST